MDSVGAFIAAILVAIALLASAGVVHYSLASTGDQSAFTEDFDPGTNQTHVTLNESNRNSVYYTSQVTVVDENDSTMRPGIDYNWHESNGTLNVLDDGQLDGDANATIDYSYRIPNQQQRTFASMLGEFINAAYLIPLVLVIAGLVAGLIGLGSLS